MKEYKAKEAYKSDEVAKEYDEIRFSTIQGGLYDKLERKAILKLLSKLNNVKTVLDIACGTGRITQMLLDQGFHAVGSDISMNMLSVARNRLNTDNLNLVACDAEKLPFKNDVFDCVTLIRVTGLIPPEVRIRMLREISRVAKYAIFSYCNPLTITGSYRKIKTRIKGEEWYSITPRSLRKELKTANLDIIDLKSILGRLSETYIVVAMNKEKN